MMEEKIDYMVLVNKEHLFKKEVKNLVLAARSLDDNEEIELEMETFLNLQKLLEEVNSIEGFRKVGIESGYRSLERQQRVMDYYIEKLGEEEALKRVAPVGSSEHHTGLATDISIIIDGKYIVGTTGDEPEMVWLKENAYKYGFILRYPKGKENITGYNYEPWHFRYVGSADIALDIKNSGLTFDEYVKEMVNDNDHVKTM